MKTKCTFNRPSRSARISLMLLFLFIGAHAGAAEPTPTDKALLERIEALEKRIEQLEGPGKKDANEPPETPGPPVEDKQVAEVPAEDLTLEKRVEKLEDAAAEAPEKSP
ncbi:MAG: hypothetical protein ACYTGS_20670, partial [Planctomycetota bacterium]